jgi:hypothetical protein
MLTALSRPQDLVYYWLRNIAFILLPTVPSAPAGNRAGVLSKPNPTLPNAIQKVPMLYTSGKHGRNDLTWPVSTVDNDMSQRSTYKCPPATVALTLAGKASNERIEDHQPGTNHSPYACDGMWQQDPRFPSAFPCRVSLY